MFAFTPSLMFLALTLFVNQSDLTPMKESSGKNDDPLSSHVLDTNQGKPGANINVKLFKFDNDNWTLVSEGVTDQDGRVRELISSTEFVAGSYKLHFDTKRYFDNLGMETFYPFVEVVFSISKPEEHYHVPLLLSAFGYSTYRGS